MSMGKKILSILLALVLCLGLAPVTSFAASVSYPVTGGNIAFDPATGAITGCDDTVTAANIPSAIYGVPVTSIGDEAFQGKKSLTSVTIPSSVTSIGYKAFQLSGLTAVTVPGSVTNIDKFAFSSCKSLTTATLQNGVPLVGSSMFSSCTKLETVSLPASVTKIDNFAFEQCESLRSVNIPSGVTEMGQSVFMNCFKLPSITIPGSVPEIPYNTFAACRNLKTVVIQNGVKTIKWEAFQLCRSLESISIPDSVTKIEHDAFSGCSSLKEAGFGAGLEEIGAKAFQDCAKLTTVGFSTGLKKVDYWAFDKCTSLTDVYYTGDVIAWSAIEMGSKNEAITTANFHWNSSFLISDWARPEMEKAEEMGLIPEVLKGQNLTRSINRLEFAAVCVKVFENLSGTQALPNVTNPFTDTNDPEVLKAYNTGITNGTSATTFSPDALLNREQCATMLTRVFKRSTMAGWTLSDDGNARYRLTYAMPAKFADDGKISGWARDSVYFMAANKIINGVGGNKFAPKNTTSTEEAQGYANATREQALAIAVRMVENLPGK